jgi:hypothetical protein
MSDIPMSLGVETDPSYLPAEFMTPHYVSRRDGGARVTALNSAG